ncbi:MAG: carbohydrate ABC transporter permease [Clostridiaceae bacterium]|nr:carbohydrate ABC transporter permease [Clostridiaceae bacterium]
MTKHNAAPRKTSQRSDSSLILNTMAYLHFLIYAVCILLPFYVMLKTSITKNEEVIATMRFIWFPKQGISFEAYKTALFSNVFDVYNISILKSFFNTLWQTLPTIMINLFSSGLSAFAFSKLTFPGKNVLFGILLATMMMPGTVLTMPSYIFYDTIGWSNTVLPLMIPGLFGGAMTVFFLRQFFQGIPNDLLEAAKIDGMGFMSMYVRIMIPLSKPAFIAQFIFAFIGGYNSYLGPLLYLNSRIPLYPLQMALSLFRGIYAHKLPVVAALTILALLPLLILYVFTQRYFVEGIASTGLKG